MGFLNLNICKAKYINVKNNQLCFSLENGENRGYLISDINLLLIDNLQTSISLSTLNELSKNKIAVLLCDEKHLPQTILTPFNSYFQMQKIFKWQTNISMPLKKQLWQSIIKEKILNQAKCLKMLGLDATPLFEMETHVSSGDAKNIEATAANYYFKQLFANKFTRKDINLINSALNYGYAIIRGLIARNIAITGLLPFLGIKHKNDQNNFNLADDLIEPFRPFVDYYIFNNFKFQVLNDDDLTPIYKKEIFNMLNFELLINNERHVVSNAIEMTVQSFVLSLKENANKIILPQLISLQEHEYE